MFDMSQFQNSMESFIRENDKSLRSIFSGKIKGTFLTAIKVNVMQMLGPEIFKYYDMQLTNEKLVSTGFEKPDFDICHHIVGIHRSNLIFNTEEERLKKEKSIEYKNALVNDVITNIKLRQYGSVFFQKQVISRGENFNYYPIIHFSKLHLYISNISKIFSTVFFISPSFFILYFISLLLENKSSYSYSIFCSTAFS